MTLTFLDRFRSRQAAPSPLVFDGLTQMRAYWEGLRKPGHLPRRSDIDPRGLEGLLDRALMAERIGQGLAQIRIAGSSLAAFAGDDLRGLPLSCLFAADSRPLLAQSLERVFAEPVLAEFDLGSDRGVVGKTIARLVILPLAEEAGQKTLLGAISLAEGVRGPCKFHLLARREERLVLPPVIPLQPAFAPEEEPRPILRRGHLSLVHFNE